MSYTVPYGTDALTFTLPAGMQGTLIESAALSPQGDSITLAKEASELGESVVEQYRVINHDARHRAGFRHLGHTPQGIPHILNKEAVEADLLIATGVVEPHNFAGYSGGAKTLTIGCGDVAVAGVGGAKDSNIYPGRRKTLC